ncbi:hypothetical protein [Companilactobacillus sp.]|jgi:hypothetical protein|uniref:hypothetical protein n=1 Tax=Companilactobacillus sp. TaxID=2767905 RepID=UPI0025C58F82|nr:hypothetical protein [Companilactobacillus sp.]MCH4008145.1 hypothetical protein [Companilactobacillus sp.]MCH4051676.1 hypothetical protein [Companilactobacillus sp.]MCH4076088.1 hypothetical protein [Companilactobacillus sp.]MCH4124663.1 hypothetical protein [Companilactobacillus sp.]MCH4132374.1 hypothetical protein [Companilactobacillus sp.]
MTAYDNYPANHLAHSPELAVKTPSSATTYRWIAPAVEEGLIFKTRKVIDKVNATTSGGLSKIVYPMYQYENGTTNVASVDISNVHLYLSDPTAGKLYVQKVYDGLFSSHIEIKGEFSKKGVYEATGSFVINGIMIPLNKLTITVY